MFQKSLLLCGISAAALMMPFEATASIAIVQDTESQSSEQSSGLDEIIVTARRREESIQDTPIAVSAFDAEALERRQISSTQDLDRITPSLQFATSGQLTGNNSGAVVFIRGVGQIDPTSSVDPGVGIYIDEVYMGRAVGGAMDFRDIASVQVLRGPQGTLFGRNTIGGAILVNTNEPGDEFGGSVRARIGEYNLREGFAAINLPLSDTVKSRVSAGIRTRDGYVNRVFDGMDLGDDNTYTFTGSVKFEPSSNFDFILRGDYTNEDENGSPFVFAGINESAPVPAIASVAAGCPGATIPFAPFAPGDAQFGAPSVPLIDDARCANDFWNLGPTTNGGTAPVESNLENWGVSGTATWALNDEVTLKSITSVRGVEWSGIRDADNTPFTLITTDYWSESSQFSQELQAQFDLGRAQGVAGIYYFDEETDDRVTVPLAFPPAPPVIISMLNGGPGSRDLQLTTLTTESIAVFTEWSYDATERLSLSGGLRYTEDDKGFQGTVLNLINADLPDPSPLPTDATSEGGPLFIFDEPFSDTYSALTGSASIQYDFGNGINSYLSYGRSFKSGGFNSRYNAPTPDNNPVSFDEETVSSWEAGLKADLTSTLRVNAAIFTSDYEDIQLIFRQGVVPLLFNAGSATISGAELEFTYVPDSDTLIEGGFSYLDDQIESVTQIPGATATITPDYSLPMTPEWKANIGASHTFHPSQSYDLTPRIDLSYTDDQFFDVGNTEIVAQADGVTYVSGSVRLQNTVNDWSLLFGVENLTDEEFIEQGNASLATLGYAEVIYARPRSWFLELSKNF